MGKFSAIEWTDHTFNPWWGCVKVSPGCKHCYAETLSNRWGHDIWGPNTSRRMFGEIHWNKPRHWNAEAKKKGLRYKVFCGSMCDVFEIHPDLSDARLRLWALIEDTPHLDWLLLTKRPENITAMIPAAWHLDPLPHVWMGTSVEDQKRADERLPILRNLPARVRWLSAEPLVGPITFRSLHKIDWVIVGGESGPECRPMELGWARDIRRHCHLAEVAFFMKQLGGYPDKGKGLNSFPLDLQVREFPDD